MTETETAEEYQILAAFLTAIGALTAIIGFIDFSVYVYEEWGRPIATLLLIGQGLLLIALSLATLKIGEKRKRGQ